MAGSKLAGSKPGRAIAGTTSGPSAHDPASFSWPCVAARGEGALLTVAVVPNARRTGADGLHDCALRVRLVAPPVEGQANDALVDWLAARLSLPKRAVRVVRGGTSRRKVIEIDSPSATVHAWLQREVPKLGAGA